MLYEKSGMVLVKGSTPTKSVYVYSLAAIGIILGYAIYIWRTFSGYYFYDDYEYAYAAFQLMEGSFSLAYDTFTHRLAFIFLLSCIFSVAGIHDFSAVLLPAVAFFGTLAILFLYLKGQRAVCFFALAITGLNSYFLFFIDKLLPDTLVTFFCLLAGVLAERYRRNYPVRAGLGVAVLLFVAFLTKETSMYLWPFFGFLMGADWLQQNQRTSKFGLSMLISGLLLFAAYFFVYYLSTSDAFYRFNSIMDNHYTHPESYFDKPFSHLLKRITYAPWLMFAESGLLVALLPGLMMAIAIIFTQKVNLQSQENFWSWYAVLFLVCFYFGTTSLRYYNPLNLLPRMYFPLLPPFAILTAIFWTRAEHSRKASIMLAVLFAAAALYGLLTQSKYTLIYAGYAGVAVGQVYVRSQYSISVMRVLFILVCLMIPVYRMISPQQWGYQAEKKMFQTYFSQTDGNFLVITDNRLMLTHKWFYQFQPPANYTFTDFAHTRQVPAADFTRKYVLFNPHTFRETFGSFAEWNLWEQHHSHQLTKIREIDGVILYEWKAVLPQTKDP